MRWLNMNYRKCSVRFLFDELQRLSGTEKQLNVECAGTGILIIGWQVYSEEQAQEAFGQLLRDSIARAKYLKRWSKYYTEHQREKHWLIRECRPGMKDMATYSLQRQSYCARRMKWLKKKLDSMPDSFRVFPTFQDV